ncbi:DinB family protein [Pseudanabaena sp. FACHB-2040]|uniref:DinB family protein n=1 Tax=Pseudanabaena sp. FACHB-2040 TaxID=2692859 RepID=UPI001688AD24|nr:DinB family protein [Pseudanabaena sp. FACHB-2040]MBD2257574.1 damage-inducible protein DinB [Pseudanabaena sp. FACHB-2040]
MITPDYCYALATYNQWMNERLYKVCASIPDEPRKQDRGAFFGSIHGTLNHLLYGDRAWMERFQRKLPSLKQMGQDLYEDFDDLRSQREAMDQEILSWAAALSEEWLAQPFEYTSNVDGKTRVLPTWVLVTHLFNHQTHHRGQLTTLLSQLGYDYGATDIPWLPDAPW